MTNEELIIAALEARKMSYAPYSDFHVGAALLTKDGKIFKGCNVENVGYSATNCAERTAFFKAVSEGYLEFEAIAIAGGKGEEPDDYAYPCGICRQVMMEFCDPKTFRVIVAISEKEYIERTLEEMLPLGFGPDKLA